MKVTTRASILIDRPIQEVYHKADEYPIFISFYDKKIIAENTLKNKTVHVGMKVFGIVPIRWSGEGEKIQNRSISYIQTRGLLKGLSAVWQFTVVNSALTKVEIILSLNSSAILSCFFNWYLRNITERLLNELEIAIKKERK